MYSEVLGSVDKNIKSVVTTNNHLTTEQWVSAEQEKWKREDKLNKVEEIPTERMDKMKAHYAMLKEKFPHMKHERIAKKVAKEFKIKLV